MAVFDAVVEEIVGRGTRGVDDVGTWSNSVDLKSLFLLFWHTLALQRRYLPFSVCCNKPGILCSIRCLTKSDRWERMLFWLKWPINHYLLFPGELVSSRSEEITRWFRSIVQLGSNLKTTIGICHFQLSNQDNNFHAICLQQMRNGPGIRPKYQIPHTWPFTGAPCSWSWSSSSSIDDRTILIKLRGRLSYYLFLINMIFTWRIYNNYSRTLNLK